MIAKGGLPPALLFYRIIAMRIMERVNRSLTGKVHVWLMSKVLITPEFIHLESPPVMRALLHHLIEHADIVDHDMSGRPVLRFEFACAPWLLDKLAAFGSSSEDLEVDPAEAA